MPWTSPLPAHCSGLPQNAHGSCPTGKAEPGSTSPPVRDEQYPKAPVCGGRGTTKSSDRGEPGARSQHQLLGGPCVPTPPPTATFPKTDIHRARAWGPVYRLPRRVPGGPVPRKTSAVKGTPKSPPTAPCYTFLPNCTLPNPSVDTGTLTRTTPPTTGERPGATPHHAFLDSPRRCTPL